MTKKILLAVDNSVSSSEAVNYTCEKLLLREECYYTLLNIQSQSSLQNREEIISGVKSQTQREMKNNIKANTKEDSNFLEKLRRLMIVKGKKQNQVSTVTRYSESGIVNDILEYAHIGLYEAIVVGRNKYSLIKNIFMESISDNLVKHARDIPVWVVCGNVKSAKMLLVVNSSQGSLRAVEHVCQMGCESPEVQINLLHVIMEKSIQQALLSDSYSNDFIEMEEALQQVTEFQDRARRMLNNAGIHDDRFKIKEAWSNGNIFKPIMAEIKNGDYGTIVLDKFLANESFFMRRIYQHVLDHIEDRAMCIVS